MSVTKVNADVFDLTDAYAFSGAVSGTTGYEFVSSATASNNEWYYNRYFYSFWNKSNLGFL